MSIILEVCKQGGKGKTLSSLFEISFLAPWPDWTQFSNPIQELGYIQADFFDKPVGK